MPEASPWAYELASIPRARDRARERARKAYKSFVQENVEGNRFLLGEYGVQLYFSWYSLTAKKKKGLLKCEKKGSRPSTASGHHYWEMLAEWQWDLKVLWYRLTGWTLYFLLRLVMLCMH